jgi:hypothetical protein
MLYTTIPTTKSTKRRRQPVSPHADGGENRRLARPRDNLVGTKNEQLRDERIVDGLEVRWQIGGRNRLLPSGLLQASDLARNRGRRRIRRKLQTGRARPTNLLESDQRRMRAIAQTSGEDHPGLVEMSGEGINGDLTRQERVRRVVGANREPLELNVDEIIDAAHRTILVGRNLMASLEKKANARAMKRAADVDALAALDGGSTSSGHRVCVARKRSAQLGASHNAERRQRQNRE